MNVGILLGIDTIGGEKDPRWEERILIADRSGGKGEIDEMSQGYFNKELGLSS